jgi:acetolactate synthase-1/2/3 large subunit
MRVADYVMDRLVMLGVRQVFFLPGGGAMHLNDALALNSQLEPVLCLHEQACGIAAEAAGKMLAGPTACLVTSGPGATNVVTATLAAWLDSTPVIFISGQVKTADLKTGTALRMLGVQEADIVTIVSQITKAAVTLLDAQDVAYEFDRLEHLALSGRRGPVWLDVPLDIQGTEIDVNSLRRWTAPPTDAPADLKSQVDRALTMLAAAERPLIVAGSGVRLAGGEQAFRTFFESLGVPVATSWLGMDLIEDNHPLYAGRPGSIAPRWANFTLQNADLVLSIGCRLDMAMTAYAHERFARGAKKIIVDIDPAEIKKMRMEVALPIVADAKSFLLAANAAIAETGPVSKYQPWLDRIQSWKERYPLLQPEHRPTAEGPLSLYHFTDVLSDQLAEGDVIATGAAGFSVELFLLALRLKRGQRCFHNRGTGSMGFGVPAAIGACVAAGRRRTICLEGDGGLQMNVQELATLAAMRIPVKCFIINNQGYASIRASQRGYFNRVLGADSTSGMLLPSLEKVADAYGIRYMRIDSAIELQSQLDDALADDGPVLCEVMVIPEEPRIPRVATKKGLNGKMESSPLEDLFPFLDREELRENMHIPLIGD